MAMSYCAILKKHVKTRYGNWLLVQLPSGNWTGVWHSVLDLEEMCEAVVTGSTRFDGDGLTVSHARRSDALQMIVTGIESEARNARSSHDVETLMPFLKKARLALLRETVKP